MKIIHISIYRKNIFMIEVINIYIENININVSFGAVDWSFDSECGKRWFEPTVETQFYNWVAPLWLVFILHVSHCLIDLTLLHPDLFSFNC